MSLSYLTISDTPVGCLLLVANSDALVEIRFLDSQSSDGGEHIDCSYSHSVLTQTVNELNEYFCGKRKQFTVPLHLAGTPFQSSVWQALQSIPYGEVVSYGEIANSIGNPKASRAVGMANNRNRIPIIIPCHRVIGKNGDLTGYAGGIDIKQWLLQLEGADIR